MNAQKMSLIAVAVVLLALYNGSQPELREMRTQGAEMTKLENIPASKRTPAEKTRFTQLSKQRYGPSMQWLDRLARGNESGNKVKLNFNVMSSMMIAGLASGFKSQVANMLWMKSDEYWHKGLFTRQVPLMEAVVTLDPQFIEAWSTAGWHHAYNIYADIENNMSKLKTDAAKKKARQEQDDEIDTGLDYLKRGSEMNPEKYRLWFEYGWTRAEKAGYYDDETVRLFRIARDQGDARTVERQVVEKGKTVMKEETGLDVIGRTIGHMFEKRPMVDLALDHYGTDLLKLKKGDSDWKALEDIGRFWAKYGEHYPEMIYVYQGGDNVTKAQIKKLVPEIDRMVEVQAVRNRLEPGAGGQPTGAFISICARYLPSWKLMEAGRYTDAIDTMTAVMNADTRYHLQGWPARAKVLEIRGDSPDAIKRAWQTTKDAEMTSSQDIGLHFLGRLYELAADKETDPAKKLALQKKAFESWLRGRERDSLDFYAKRNARKYEDEPYNFKAPEAIIKAIKDSRKSGNVNAAPPPPNVAEYYKPHTGDHDHEHEGESDTP